MKRLSWVVVLCGILAGCSGGTCGDNDGGADLLADLPAGDGGSEILPDDIGSEVWDVAWHQPSDGLVDVGKVAFAVEEEIVVTMALEGLQIGVVDALDELTNYDPYPLVAEGADPLYLPPEGLEWLEPEEIVTTGTGKYRLTYPGGIEVKLGTFIAGGDAQGLRVKFELLPVDVDRVAYFRLALSPGEQEVGYYGLGEVFDTVNHDGLVRAMQIEVDPKLESFYNEAHVPIPFLISTAGWGLFVDNDYPGVFDVCATDPDRVQVTYGTGTGSSEGFLFYVMLEEHPLDLTRHYYQMTGDFTLPAQWAYGPWIWRDENEDQAQVESDLLTIRELDLPTSGYWIDRPYASAVNTFDFHPEQFPDADAMIALMHSLGFRTALWHTPYLDEKKEETAALRQHAEEQGFYPLKYGMLLNKWGVPIDLTNTDAYAWWRELIWKYTDRGIEGFKLDYGEDVVVGVSGKRINIWEFANGEDERTMHERYNLFYHQVYAETLPEDGGFLLCRHSVAGDQTNGVIIWPGDLDANFARHGETVTEPDGETYVAVGGLPAALTAALSLGPSGFPFYGSDTGGYRHAPPDEETFIRWFESTAVSTVMQIGTSSNDVAWEFFNETNDPDGEKLGWYRKYTRLHLRLFPYVWGYAEGLDYSGRAIMRPLGLAYPELGVHPSDTYLMGDDLLVAPVVERGATTRNVHFPPGDWMDWWTGEVIEGPGEKTVDAPLGVLPLYQRLGSIIPLLRPTIDTLAPTDQPDLVDSLATTPDLLHAKVVLSSSHPLWEPCYDQTLLKAAGEEDGVRLEYAAGSLYTGGIHWELPGFGPAPESVEDEKAGPLEQAESVEQLYEKGEPAWAWTAEMGGTLHVHLPDAGEWTTIVKR